MKVVTSNQSYILGYDLSQQPRMLWPRAPLRSLRKSNEAMFGYKVSIFSMVVMLDVTTFRVLKLKVHLQVASHHHRRRTGGLN